MARFFMQCEPAGITDIAYDRDVPLHSPKHVGPRQINDLVAASIEHRLDHEKTDPIMWSILIDGGRASSWRFTTTSTRAGPS